MASNPLDLTDLYSKAAIAQNAKFGGYGNSNGMLRAIGGLLGGLANMRNVGIVPALGTGIANFAEARNAADYNKYLQKQAIQQAKEQDANNQQSGRIMGATTKQPGLFERINPRTGQPESYYSGDIKDIKTITEALGIGDSNKALSQYRQGENPTETGVADPGMLKEMTMYQMQRADKLNDVNATLKDNQEFTGQAPFFGGKPFAENTQGILSKLAGGLQGELDQGGALQAGVNKSVRPEATGYKPNEIFGVGVPDVGQLLTSRNNEFDNFNAYRGTNEDIRSNQAKEALAKQQQAMEERRLQDQIAKNYYKNWPPTGGGRSGQPYNPWPAINGQQNFMEGQVSAIDSQLKGLGFMDSSGKIKTPDTMSRPGGWFGIGAHEPTANDLKAAELINRRQAIQSQIFGGQSGQKLEQAGKNASQQASAGKSKAIPGLSFTPGKR